MGQFKDPELALAKEVILQAQAQTTKWVTMTLVLSCVGVLGVTGIMMGVYLSGNLGKGDDADDAVNIPVMSQAMKGANLESDVAQNHLDLSLTDPMRAPKMLHTTTPHSDDDDDRNSLSKLNRLNAKEFDKGFLASEMNNLNMIGKEMLMLPHLTRKPNAKPIILPPSTIKEDITTSVPVDKLTFPANTAPMPNAVTFDTTIKDFTISSNINSITNNFLGNVRDMLHNNFFQQLSPNDYDDNSYEFESKEKTEQKEGSEEEMSSGDTTSEETTSKEETSDTDNNESSLKEQANSDESSSKEQANSKVSISKEQTISDESRSKEQANFEVHSETQIDEHPSKENSQEKPSSEEETAENSMEDATIAAHTLATDSKSSENQSRDKLSKESKEKDSSSEEDSNEKQTSKEFDDNSHMVNNKDISAHDDSGSNEVVIIKQAELDYDDSYEFEHIIIDEKFKPIVATSLTLPDNMKSKESSETSDSSAISVETDKMSSHDSYDSDEQNSVTKSRGIEGKDANVDTSDSFEFASAETLKSIDHSSEIAIEVLKNRNTKEEDSITINKNENVSDKVKLSLGNNRGRYSYEEISSKSASEDSDVTEQIDDKSQHNSTESTTENKSKESEKSSEEREDTSIESSKHGSGKIQDDASNESEEDSEEIISQGSGNSKSKEKSSERESYEIVPDEKSEKSSETEESKESGEISTLTETSKSDEDSFSTENSNENSIEKSKHVSQNDNSDSDDKSSLIDQESEESEEDVEQESNEKTRDDVDNSNNQSSEDSDSDEQSEESFESLKNQQASKQSESKDSSGINMGVIDDSSEEKNSNEKSTEDIYDNSKADQISIENYEKEGIRESETSKSSNNDDTSTERGDDSMLNMIKSFENKSINDKSQPDDSNENDSSDKSESNKSDSSELAAKAQQIQSSSRESKEEGDEYSSEEGTVNKGDKDSKSSSNELDGSQSEKDENDESEDDSENQSVSISSQTLDEDSKEKSNENSESVNYDNSNDVSDESADISRSESSVLLKENLEHSHQSGINSDQSGSDENQKDSSVQDSSDHSEDINNNHDSSKHADKDDSSQRSEQGDSRQNSEQDDSTQHSEQGYSSKHSEQGNSSQHSEQDSSQHSEQGDSSQLSEQSDSSQHSEQGDSVQNSGQDDSSHDSSQHSDQDDSGRRSEQGESRKDSEQSNSSKQSEQNDSSHDADQEASDQLLTKDKSSQNSEQNDSSESTEDTRAHNDASAVKIDVDHADYNYPTPFTSEYSDHYSSFYYYNDLLKGVNNHKNSKDTTDSDNTKVSAKDDDESGEKSRESKESKDTFIQNEVKRPSSKPDSDENVEETAVTPSKDSGDYYDDNLYFDFLSGLLEKSKMNADKSHQKSSIVSEDKNQASEESTGNNKTDDSKEDAPFRAERQESKEIRDSNVGSGEIYTNPWASEQHSQRDETDDAMSQFFNFAVTRNPMENGYIHGITNGFNSVMTTPRPIVPAAEYDDDEESQRGRSLGFLGASDDQHGGISSLHNGHAEDNTYTRNRHFSLNDDAQTENFGSNMFSGIQNFGLFDPFERSVTNIQQHIQPTLNNDQSFAFSGFNQQPENGGLYNGHSRDFVGYIDGSVHNTRNFQENWNQNLHQIGSQQWNPQHTGNERSPTDSFPATESSLQTNTLSTTGFDLLSRSPSATGSGLSPSITSDLSNGPLPSSSFAPQNSGSEQWSTGDKQASASESSRQDRNIFLDPQTNYFSNAVHRNAFGAPNDQFDFNINFANGNQPVINNQPVGQDQQFYGDNNHFSVQSGSGASFGVVQNIPTSSQQVRVTNDDSEERDDETSSGLHKSSLSSIVQPSNVYRNPYAADDDFSDDHHESHQYANHNQERTNNDNYDENNDSSEDNNDNDDDTDR